MSEDVEPIVGPQQLDGLYERLDQEPGLIVIVETPSTVLPLIDLLKEFGNGEPLTERTSKLLAAVAPTLLAALPPDLTPAGPYTVTD